MKLHFSIDPFLAKLLLAVLLASLLPVYGTGTVLFGWATNFAIALLFFLHGARLSREAIVAGASHWRLHLAIFSATFILFPVIGVLAKPAIIPFTTPDLYLGILFLCCLPATVQSAIAFTSIARGNVSAAVCSASASNLMGVFLTPLLAGLVMAGADTGNVPISFDAVGKIMLQLLLPFIMGQMLRRWIGRWVIQHGRLLRIVDQGSILLVVYTAFSAAVMGGLWSNTPPSALVSLIIISLALLGLVLGTTLLAGRLLKFDIEDRITLLFCGSKKSLSTGIPIANILFADDMVGAIVLPLMIFHQIQLIVCAIIARAYSQRRIQSEVQPVPNSSVPST